MGVFRVRMKVSRLGARRMARVNAVVDTGAAVSVVPGKTLRRLGIKPLKRSVFTTANGERVEREVGVAWFVYDGSEGGSEVIFGEPRDPPLVGAMTLESLGLRVNPRTGRLEKTDYLLL